MKKTTTCFSRVLLPGLVAMLLTGPTALAQLSGAYTINSAQPTAGTNYASFVAAATALNTGGVSGPVTFGVLGGPYTEQLRLTNIVGSSATNRVTFNGNGRTIKFGSNVSTQRAVITLDGADFVTLDSLTVDATNGGSPGTYGWGVQLVNNANNNVVSHCTITSSLTANTVNFAGIVSSASTTVATTNGAAASQNLTLRGNTITGGYYAIAVLGATVAAPTPGIVLRNNRVQDYGLYGLYGGYLTGAQIQGNDFSRPTRTGATSFYGIFLTTATQGALVTKNRVHNSFGGGGTGFVYGMALATGTSATAANPNVVANNLVYDLSGSTVYCLYNNGGSNNHYYYNTVSTGATASISGVTYGFYNSGTAGVEFKNNVVSLQHSNGGQKYAIYQTSATVGSLVSNNNDLYGTGANFNTGYYSTAAVPGLTAWQAVGGRGYDAASVAANPQFVAPASGNLQPTAGQLNAAATPIAGITDDITGVPRSLTAPDMGAYEFTPAPDDVALVSIDSPTSPAAPGTNPVRVTVRNGGAAVLSSVTVSYVLNGGTPVSQTFTGLTVAPNATQQLTFTALLTPLSGSNTLVVTATLPNGQPDPTPTNNDQSLTFQQPIPTNDDPCQAVALTSSPTAGSNSGATTTVQPGIVLPACAPSQAPKDVWFSCVATGNTGTFTVTGTAAGMVRVFTAPTCTTGPFSPVACRAATAANAGFAAPFVIGGLVAGTTYYVAVSGYGSADAAGQFSIQATFTTVSASRTAAEAALAVFPNPSHAGQFVLRLPAASAGTAQLLNALGQTVRTQPLASGPETTVATQGLAAGVYTLQVRTAAGTVARRVVLE